MSGILKISDACTIAFHAIVYLAANSKRCVRNREISEKFKISEAHLYKVIQRLRRQNLVRTCSGPNGGIMINRNPEKISLLEVYEAIDGGIDSGNCLLKSYVCSSPVCIMKNMVKDINSRFLNFLKDTCISDLTGMCEINTKNLL